MNEIIKHISIELLEANAKNPRKNLGDLKELTESIKQNGIMQNLTVVPNGEKYTVIIGHRRLAAAKLAGCKTVPCFVSEMDEKEQARTMLMENMQRKDLSVYEQAQGFQLMLDLGDTLKDIAKYTGFTQKTIKDRVNLLDLDAKKFAETEDRNISIEEYVRLEQIKSVEDRNALLKFIGTDNYSMELKKAIEKQEKEAFYKKAEKVLSTFAEPAEGYPEGYRWFRGWYKESDIEVFEDAAPGMYKYSKSSFNIAIYKKYQDKPQEESIQSPEEKLREEKRKFYEGKTKEHDTLVKNITELHNEFLSAFNEWGKYKNRITEWVALLMCNGEWGNFFPMRERDVTDVAAILDIKAPEGDIDNFNDWPDLMKLLKKEPLKVIVCGLVALNSRILNDFGWTKWDDGCSRTFFDEEFERTEFYKLLADLGYRPGEEERLYIAGKHPVFDEYKEK